MSINRVFNGLTILYSVYKILKKTLAKNGAGDAILVEPASPRFFI